jgi:hypothetical protein
MEWSSKVAGAAMRVVVKLPRASELAFKIWYTVAPKRHTTRRPKASTLHHRRLPPRAHALQLERRRPVGMHNDGAAAHDVPNGIHNGTGSVSSVLFSEGPLGIGVLPTTRGLAVVRVDGRAQVAGVHVHDVLVSINGAPLPRGCSMKASAWCALPYLVRVTVHSLQAFSDLLGALPRPVTLGFLQDTAVRQRSHSAQ